MAETTLQDPLAVGGPAESSSPAAEIGTLKPGKLARRFVVIYIIAGPLVGAILAGSDAASANMKARGIEFLIGLVVFLAYRLHRFRVQAQLNASALALVAPNRDFVLYLRPFFTSGRLMVRNNLPSVLDRFLVGKYWDAELALSFAFEESAPLVAIGSKRRSYGAAKLVASDVQWTSLFRHLAERAKLIWIVPFPTPGTLVEMQYLAAEPKLRDKLVVMMPPSYFMSLRSLLRTAFGRSYGRRWHNAQTTLRQSQICLPDYDRRGGFFLLQADGTCSAAISLGRFDREHLERLRAQLEAAYSVREQPERFAALRAGIDAAKKRDWNLGRRFVDRFVPSVPTVAYSFLIAVFIRTFLFQPFNIPSGSMKDTLLVGDYIFVSKFSYGYSHYSLPYSPPLFSGRLWSKAPQRGDVVVFRLPKNDTVDYVKRIVGLPGDRIQMIDGVLYINGQPVKRERVDDFVETEDVRQVRVKRWRETLPNGVSYTTLDLVDNFFLDNTPEYRVPPDHYFMLGDNRDNSTDSRTLNQVGYVPSENILGPAVIKFFSVREGESAAEFWRWPSSVRWERLVQPVR
jgi:signal peptidase I